MSTGIYKHPIQCGFQRWNIINLGRKFGPISEEKRKKLSLLKVGNKNPAKREDVRRKISRTISFLGRWKKEKNPNWRGGVSENNKDYLRKTLEYRIWRDKVFKRDNYVCQNCGERGGKLNVHHIMLFSLYPKLRYKIENGRTLCIECHKKTSTYGWKALNLI